MNTFYELEDFCGYYNSKNYSNHFQQFLEFAAQIRTKLEKKSYLLDAYLSHVFLGIDIINKYNATYETDNLCGRYWSLCVKMVENGEINKDDPLYEAIKQDFLELQQQIPLSQEADTQEHLLFFAVCQRLYNYAVIQCQKEIHDYLIGEMDLIEIHFLQTDITKLIGEPLMEELNEKIRALFQVTTKVSEVIQCISDVLLRCIVYRDNETSKQIFQLLLDRCG